MNRFGYLRRQRGATLVVGLIMLALLMILVTSAFTLSSSNLKAVGNMQFRNEALAAANMALEQVAGSAFTTATAGETIDIDLNNDGTTDYVVTVTQPECIRATTAGDPILSSKSLPASMSAASDWNTVWNIAASVTDPTTGASVRVQTGIRALRSQAQKDAECP